MMTYLYNNQRLLKANQLLLWSYFGILLISSILKFLRQGVPVKFYPDDLDFWGLNNQYYLQLIIGFISVLTSLAFCVLFIVWFYRAYENVRTVAPEKATLATGWAIGCWFVPILNLFRPYRIMLEIWEGTQRGSTPSPELSTIEKPNKVNAWWISCMLGLAIGVLSTYLLIRGLNSSTGYPTNDYNAWQQNAVESFKNVQFLLLSSSLLQLFSLIMLSLVLDQLSKFEAELRIRHLSQSQPSLGNQ